MAAVGLADDIWSLPPTAKFLGQVLAIAVVVAVAQNRHVAFPGWPALLLASLWVIAYANFFNFMDGSDGLAAGVAAINALALAVLAIQLDRLMLAWAALAVTASSVGFLRYNYAPASVFMGDTGSLFLGYTFGLYTVLWTQAGGALLPVMAALTPVFFDAVYTLARRAYRREAVWRAHRSHLYQRLLILGYSHRIVAHWYYVWAAACGLLALAILGGDALTQSLGVLAAAVPGVVAAAVVRRAERRIRVNSGVERLA